MLLLYERIKLLRTQKNISQSDLAKMTGYKDRSSIAKIEKGIVDLSETKIKLFAKALNTTPSYLMGWSEEQQPTTIETKIQDNVKQLNNENKEKTYTYTNNLLTEQNKLSIIEDNHIHEEKELYEVYVTEKVAAGVGYSYGENENILYYTDRNDLPSYDFATLVTGDSMFPVYENGDVILLRQGYDSVNGDIYVIDYDGKSYVKKLYNDGNRFVLKSINEKYEDIVIYLRDLEENSIYFNIVGKVIDSFKPAKR